MAPPGKGWQQDGGGKGSKGGKGGGKPRGGDEDGLDDGGEGLRRRGQGKGRGKGGTPSSRQDTAERERSGSGGLNSNARDFAPQSGFGQGGYEDPMSQYWGWPQSVPMLPPLWTEYRDKESGDPYYYNRKTGLCQWEKPPELEAPKPSAASEGALAAGAPDRSRDGAIGGRREEADKLESRREGGAGGKGAAAGGRGAATRSRRRGGGKSEDSSEFGPPGCNLFVFHLPDDWTDDDLHEYFSPHGSVVSAKVMKELGTGRSRGFGFVSYEDRVSAATAIKKMQGYKILGKRLKVEFKKGEHDSKGEAEDLDVLQDDEGGPAKKGSPDDERLIGYLRAISAKNVVQSLKEFEGGGEGPED